MDIVRHGLDEATAFEVEAALIDSLPQLTNVASATAPPAAGLRSRST